MTGKQNYKISKDQFLRNGNHVNIRYIVRYPGSNRSKKQ